MTQKNIGGITHGRIHCQAVFRAIHMLQGGLFDV